MPNSASIEEMFNMNTPLGPIATPFDDVKKASHLHDLIFDPQTSLSRRSRDLRPWVIVGRRGAGKTAFLYQRCFSGEYEHQIVIESAQIFRTICRSIENVLDISQNKHAPFVENVSNIWKSIFVTSAISMICRNYRNKSSTANDEHIISMINYLESININRQSSPSTILNHLTRKARDIGLELNLEKHEDIEDILLNQLGVGEAEEALEEFCNKYNKRIIILIDSVEHFPTDDFHMDIAASGLLHLLSYLRLSLSPINICFCIPSEIYNHFSRHISANPEKDFENKLMLQWTSYDLIKMTALRLDKFLTTPRQKRLRIGEGLTKTPNRENIYEFWWSYLPRKVVNNLEEVEDSFAYILRHTQLLPRHVIGIFNEIIRLSISRDDENLDITEDDIKRGVKLASDSICDGILSSYRYVHPSGHDLCENMLPHMKNSFTMSEFRIFFRNYGRGIVKNYYDAFQIFKQLGIFGIVTGESKIYYQGEFEYTQPSSMAASEDDVFCIHPAFAGKYRVGLDNGGPTSEKEVHPHGTDLDENLAA